MVSRLALAASSSGHDSGHAEVGDHDPAALALDQYVLWDQVAVADAAAMCVGQARCYSLGDAAGLNRLEALVMVQKVGQGHAIHEFHGDVVLARALADIKYPNDVRVVQARRDHDFSMQGTDDVPVGHGGLVEDLQGHRFATGFVPGLEYRGRGALGQRVDDFVAVQGFWIQVGRPCQGSAAPPYPNPQDPGPTAPGQGSRPVSAGSIHGGARSGGGAVPDPRECLGHGITRPDLRQRIQSFRALVRQRIPAAGFAAQVSDLRGCRCMI